MDLNNTKRSPKEPPTITTSPNPSSITSPTPHSREATPVREQAAVGCGVAPRMRIPPAPQRLTDSTWLASDFFHADCVVTLQQLYCFFVMEVSSRYVHISA
jgi:hypothetical protein